MIATLFKGGNKIRDNPDNYRAVTLSSVVLKLLERLLLTRIELFDSIRPPLHPLQGGFLWEPDRSGYGICVSNMSCGSPAVADDMLLLSLSKFGWLGSDD